VGVIRETKRSDYNRQISNSQNRIKATQDIIICKTGQIMESAKISSSEIDSEIFNNYFLRNDENITQNISNKTKYTI
jgi:hypothetical protein